MQVELPVPESPVRPDRPDDGSDEMLFHVVLSYSISSEFQTYYLCDRGIGFKEDAHHGLPPEVHLLHHPLLVMVHGWTREKDGRGSP
jgi:hypothetical protein